MVAARCKRILKKSCYSSLLFSLSLAFPASAFAGFVQEQYYDWGVSDRRTPTVLGLSVRAQETTTGTPTAQPTDPAATGDQPTDTTTTTTLTTDLTSGGILSGNPLHFFDTTFETLQETFTFDPEAKAELKLDHAEERLSEANTLVETGNIDEATQTFEDYEVKMADATDDLVALKDQGVDVTGLADSVEQATAKHTTVLEEVALKVPEQATGAIQNALLVSQTGMDRAADAKGEPPIPVDLLARMNALRGQGILTEEEAGSLINSGSREEARNFFKNLVDQGVLPEADYKRFDTAQAKYLPQEFVRGVEMSKFNELRRLEGSGEPSAEIKAQMEQFAGTYKPGDIVPPEIRRHWAQAVRLEEVQKTIRPDLLSSDLFAGRQEDFSKLQELQGRVRPTSQEAALAEQYLKNNPGQSLPPEIQRILDLKDRVGVLSEGAKPPPGHKESTFLPSSVFKYFGEIPFQLGAPSVAGGFPTPGGTGTGSTGTYSGAAGGGYHPPTAEDYQKYFQGSSFLPQPTYTTSGGAPTGTSGTTGGDFRYPYYPAPGTTGDSTYHPPSGTTGTYTQPSYSGTSGGTTYTQPSYSSGTTYTAPSTSTGTTSTYQAPSTSTYTAPSTSTSEPAPTSTYTAPSTTTSEPAPTSTYTAPSTTTEPVHTDTYSH